MTYKAHLNAKLNGAARVTLHSLELVALDRLAMIKAKAVAHIANHPAPRAYYSQRVQVASPEQPVVHYLVPLDITVIKPTAPMYRNATNFLAFYLGLSAALLAAFN